MNNKKLRDIRIINARRRASQRAKMMNSFKVRQSLPRKQVPNQKKAICSHCNKPIAIRNQSGYCDHLYYPENCSICKQGRKKKIWPLIIFILIWLVIAAASLFIAIQGAM